MQRRIDEIRRELSCHPARTAWDKGVRGYAVELFDEYIEGLKISDSSIRIGKIKETDLLKGAKDWNQYSFGGCAEANDSDICARLCNKAEIKKTRNGELPLVNNEDWLDVQTRALREA